MPVLTATSNNMRPPHALFARNANIETVSEPRAQASGPIVLALGILLTAALLPAQTYDLVLKGGHVIDPANNIDRVMDIAVTGNRIARVAPDIPAKQGTKAVNLTGLYVTPGLVDIHAHVYVGGRLNALFPDDTALIAGSTTVVDAGISGWRTFDDFKRVIIDKSKTRVLAFLNIVGHGMGGSKVENNVADMDPVATAKKVKQY